MPQLGAACGGWPATSSDHREAVACVVGDLDWWRPAQATAAVVRRGLWATVGADSPRWSSFAAALPLSGRAAFDECALAAYRVPVKGRRPALRAVGGGR